MLSFSDKFRLEQMQEEWAFQAKMHELMDKSPAYKDYYSAALESRKSATSDEMRPDLNAKFEVGYTARQGIKAACLTREDVDTIARVQLSVLERLDRIQAFQYSNVEGTATALILLYKIRRLAWVAVGLLVYISYRLS